MTYRLLTGVRTPGQALRCLIPPVGFVLALINTTPIVAMLIPAPAEPGALCLVTASSADVLADSPLVALWQQATGKAPQTGKTWVALGILVAVILAGSFGIAPVELAAVTGAVLMVLTGVLTPRSAVRALNWNILAIIAGSIGLGVIVVNSGLGGYISAAILELSGDSTALVVLVIAVGTTILTNVVTNAAAASILTPVVLTIAASTGLDPMLLLITVGTCISFTFFNPFSHQSNLMVMRPGAIRRRRSCASASRSPSCRW